MKQQKDMQKIRERLDDALEADEENRDKALDDLEFIAGYQWPDDIRRAREADGKPCLTINRMPQFVRQITGDIRQSNPAIDVYPGDGDASEEMAEVIGGVVRSLEYRSDASSVYERAAESAASCGIGHFRVTYEAGPQGNEIVIKGIPNPFAVVWDPLSKDPTRKDARYCFVMQEMQRDEFKAKYPGKDPLDVNEGSINQSYRHWFTSDTVTVAEYWRKDGDKVYFCKVSGAEKLSKEVEWPGKHIPVLAVCGEEIHLGNRTYRSSAIRHAKDSQRLYNFWRSAQAEIVGLQSKAPFLVTAKQIKGHEGMWNTSHLTSRPYLLYNIDGEAGRPERQMPPTPSQGAMQEVMIAADEMKSTTGIYDAALGNQSNEKSGVAIRQRQMESDISTSIYIDNLSKSIAQCGRVILDLIKSVYDTTRTIQTMAVDGSTKMVDINVPMMTPMGPVYVNDPSFGQYDVRVKTGPSYSTQKQESVESMMQFVQAFPAAAQVAGDLIARNMDWPGAEDLADRLAKMLPPGMAESEEQLTPEQMQMQQQQAQMAEMMQQMQMMMQQLSVEKAKAETDEAKADAAKAGLEVQEKQLELAVNGGQLDAAVQEAVARTIQAMLPRAAF